MSPRGLRKPVLPASQPVPEHIARKFEGWYTLLNPPRNGFAYLYSLGVSFIFALASLYLGYLYQDRGMMLRSWTSSRMPAGLYQGVASEAPRPLSPPQTKFWSQL